MSDAKEHHHILPVRTYLTVGTILLAFTALTVMQSQIDLGAANLIIAMIIAAAKALLVALFFMHLLWDNKLYLLIFATTIVFLALFIIFTMLDTQRRDDIYEIRGQKVEEQAVIYRPGAQVEAAAIDSVMADSADMPGSDSAASAVDSDSLSH